MLKSSRILHKTLVSNLKRFSSSTGAATESNQLIDSLLSNVDKSNTTQPAQAPAASFAKLFKESKFVSLGDMENKYLIGKIVDVVGDDLYIDYGGKFNCVCKKPARRANLYVRNANVKIKLISFEMSAYFLNAAKNITLLESDAQLVDIYRPDTRKTQEEKEEQVSEQKELAEKFNKEVKQMNSEPYY